MSADEKTRQHETVMELPGTVEQAWAAITDTSQVQSWFAPEARVDLRPGGDYFVSWGPGMEGAAKIESIDAPRHLRVVTERRLREGAEPVRVAMDYYIEPREGGGTVLRLVHSGFLNSAEWDGEFEGTRQGWPMMFRILRYGLAKHPGVGGRQAWLYVSREAPAAEVWKEVVRLAPADAVEYSVELKEFFARWDEMGDGLIYAALGGGGAKTAISFTVVLYGDAAGRIGEAGEYWRGRLVQA